MSDKRTEDVSAPAGPGPGPAVWENFFDLSFDVMSVTDAEGRFQRLNPAFEKVLGWPASELASKSFLDLAHPDDRGLLQTGLARLQAGPTATQFESRCRRRDGTYTWLTWRGQSTPDKRLYLTGREVTEQQFEETLIEKEQALREVTELQRAILDNAEYSIISTTPDGIIQTFNPAAERMLGYTAEEVVGRENMALFHDLSEIVDRAQTFSRELETVIEPGFEVFAAKARHNLPNQYEWTYICKDNTRLPVQISMTALRDEAGRITGFLSIAQDITQRKRVETTLAKQAAELAIVATISASVSQITASTQLLQTVVDLTKENFDLYHAHIYLLNDSGDRLNLAAGAGEIGRQMTAEGWHISMDEDHSLVAQAARMRQGIISNNVRENPHFLPNPLLPNTRSEMSVPIMIGNKLLGVLDVQADSLNRFTAEDIRIKTTLAIQVAVALQNARSFERSEQAIRELNTLTRRLIREGWESYRREHLTERGYVYDLQRLSPVRPGSPEATAPPQASKLEQPVVVRGETIGLVEIAGSPRPEDYTQDIVAAVVERLGSHLENLRLTEQTQAALAEAEKQAQRLVVLNETAAALNQAADERQILNITAAKVSQFVKNERLSVTLVDFENNDLEVIVLDGQEGAIPTGSHLPLVGTAVGRAVRENKLLTTEDLENGDFLDYQRMKEQGLTSVLLAPLRTTWGEAIGTLNISRSAVETYTTQDKNLWRQMASLLASTIENRRLFAQTQAALEEANIFRQFVETAGQGVGLATLDGRVRYINPAMAAILEEDDREAVVDKPVAAYYPDDLRKFLLKAILPTVMERGQWSGETQLLSTGGRHTPVIENYFLVRDEQGQPLYIADIATDITQRKAVEAELRKLSQAVEQSPSVVVITNPKGVIEYVNPRFTRLTGYTAQEAIGKNPRLLKSGQVPVEEYKRLWGAITSGQEWRGELINRKKGGDLYWAAASISPILDDRGNITHFLAIQEDITERKVAEAEQQRLLNEVQESYRQYVRREWEQFLGERHRGRWHIEHHRAEPAQADPATAADGPALETAISILGQTVGTLRLQDIDPDRQWTAEEAVLIEAVAEQLGLTIENLRLFESTQKQATREQLTRRITDKMRASPDIDSIIQAGLDELAKALGVSRTYVKLATNPDQIGPDREPAGDPTGPAPEAGPAPSAPDREPDSTFPLPSKQNGKNNGGPTDPA